MSDRSSSLRRVRAREASLPPVAAAPARAGVGRCRCGWPRTPPPVGWAPGDRTGRAACVGRRAPVTDRGLPCSSPYPPGTRRRRSPRWSASCSSTCRTPTCWSSTTGRPMRTRRGAGGRREVVRPAVQRRGGRRDADGFLHAARSDYDAVVQVDADGQHDPACVARCSTRSTAPSVVVGARFAAGGGLRVRGPRRWAMRLLSVVAEPVARHPADRHDLGLPGRGPRGDPALRPALPGGVPRRHHRLAGDRRSRRAGHPRGPGRDAAAAGRAAEPRAAARPRSTSAGPCSRWWSRSRGVATRTVNPNDHRPPVRPRTLRGDRHDDLRRRAAPARHPAREVRRALAGRLGRRAGHGRVPAHRRLGRRAVGVQVPANLLFFLTAVLLLLVSVQLSYEVSRLEARTRRLAEEIALLREAVRELQDRCTQVAVRPAAGASARAAAAVPRPRRRWTPAPGACRPARSCRRAAAPSPGCPSVSAARRLEPGLHRHLAARVPVDGGRAARRGERADPQRVRPACRSRRCSRAATAGRWSNASPAGGQGVVVGRDHVGVGDRVQVPGVPVDPADAVGRVEQVGGGDVGLLLLRRGRGGGLAALQPVVDLGVPDRLVGGHALQVEALPARRPAAPARAPGRAPASG